MRLLTYNVMRGGRGREDLLASVVNSVTPDLVLLQEARDPAFVEELAEATGMQHTVAAAGHSVAAMSRAPIASSRWHAPRGVHHPFLELQPEQVSWRVVAVHLAPFFWWWRERVRTREAVRLLEVAGHGDGEVVLAGDFNSIAPGDPVLWRQMPARVRALVYLSGGRVYRQAVAKILDAGFIDAYRQRNEGEGFTLPAASPHGRLDYVFLSSALSPALRACRVVSDPSAAVRASDHLPVLAELATGPREEVTPCRA